jgi:hypothetical protein
MQAGAYAVTPRTAPPAGWCGDASQT